MYKSKLQEFCHKKRWALPKYSCIRDGPDHNPQFKASVIVSGTNFDTATACKSLKEAYNEAAKLAFLHFASEVDAGEQKSDSKHQSWEVHPNSLDMQHVAESQQKYKMKLQIYAQRNNLGLPVYHNNKEGPANAPCFRTSVTVGESSYSSLGFYKTIKQSEDTAAQAALLSLSTEAFQENDVRLFKNLLQEFARSKGYFAPQYKTNRTGEAHDPTFYATVEVEGEVFQGNTAKSKKEAELNAAKVAYMTFMQRKSCQMGEFSSSSSEDDVLKLTSRMGSHTIADPSGNSKSESPSFSISTANTDAQTEVSKVFTKIMTDEEEEAVLNGNIPAKYKLDDKETISVPFATVFADSSTNVTTDIESYLLCSRIRVYKYIPDVASSCKGNVVLPIADDKWVVVNLEFPG